MRWWATCPWTPSMMLQQPPAASQQHLALLPWLWSSERLVQCTMDSNADHLPASSCTGCWQNKRLPMLHDVAELQQLARYYLELPWSSGWPPAWYWESRSGLQHCSVLLRSLPCCCSCNTEVRQRSPSAVQMTAMMNGRCSSSLHESWN